MGKGMRIPRIIMLVLVLLSSQAAVAQTGGIFTPFVSRLNAEVSGRAVRLKWLDSPSAKGPVYVYRARVPFTGTGAEYQARGLEVPYGQQIFVEEVEALGMWYYFVVSSDETRMKYEIVVPYNNIVDVQLDGTTKNVPPSPGLAGTSGTSPYVDRPLISQPAQRAAEDPTWNSAYGSYGVARQGGYSRYSNDIVEIKAQALPNGIYISFRSSERDKNTLLYRSSKPFTHYNDILTAALVKDHVTSPYIDYPPAGMAYYYALIYEEDIRSGQATIYPGNNATVDPVHFGTIARGASGSAGTPAYSPAPATPQQSTYLDPGSGYFSTVRSPSPLSAEAAAVAEAFRNQTEPAPVIPRSSYGINMEPRVFNQDVQSNIASGEDYELALIVRGSFFSKNWGVACMELERYLAVSHSQNAAVRARFYLGQCYYFMGNARAALNEFMAVHTLYPDEVASWVQAALAKTAEQR
jgi:tetratricopeptide (TPR) repeat protein